MLCGQAGQPAHSRCFLKRCFLLVLFSQYFCCEFPKLLTISCLYTGPYLGLSLPKCSMRKMRPGGLQILCLLAWPECCEPSERPQCCGPSGVAHCCGSRQPALADHSLSQLPTPPSVPDSPPPATLTMVRWIYMWTSGGMAMDAIQPAAGGPTGQPSTF